MGVVRHTSIGTLPNIASDQDPVKFFENEDGGYILDSKENFYDTASQGPRVSQVDTDVYNLQGKNYQIAFDKSGFDGAVLKGTVFTTVDANP